MRDLYFNHLKNREILFMFFVVDGRFCKRRQNLVAAIYGGAEVIRGVTENITMNGSVSYDPETGDNIGMNFTWRYGTIPRSNHSSLQLLKQGSFTHVNTSAIQNSAISYGRTSWINSNFTNENVTLVIILTVAKDYLTSSVIQVVHLIEGSPPRIYQRYGTLFFPIDFEGNNNQVQWRLWLNAPNARV